MRALREAYLQLLPNVPLNEFDRYPMFKSFNMSIKIMVWNVQGVGNKVAVIREVVRINDPSVLALVETHMSGDQAQAICNRLGFSGQKRVEAQGFRGGIWLFWRRDCVDVTYFDNSSQHLTVEVSKIGEEPWLFSAIYASPNSSILRELWRELEAIKGNYRGPWLIAGDFNETSSMSERVGVGGAEMSRRCRNFSDWIDRNGWLDLGCSGPQFTWARYL